MKMTWMLSLAAVLVLGLEVGAKPATQAPNSKQSTRVAQRRAVMPELLSYAQLMSLSKSKRLDYLREVRVALAQFEMMQNRMYEDTRTTAMVDTLKEMIAQLTVMDSAHADTDAGLPQMMSFTDAKGDTKWKLTCGPMGSGDNKVFQALDPQLNVCVRSVAGVTKVNLDAVCTTGFTAGGYIVHSDESNFGDLVKVCIADSSMKSLKPGAQDALKSFGLEKLNGKVIVPTVPTVYNSRAAAQAAVNSMSSVLPESREAISSSGPAMSKAETKAAAKSASVASDEFVRNGSARKMSFMDTIKARKDNGGALPQLVNGQWTCTDSNYTFRTYLGTCAKTWGCKDANEGVTISQWGRDACVSNASLKAMSPNQRELLCPPDHTDSQASGAITCTPQESLEVTGTDPASVTKVLGSGSDRLLAQARADSLYEKKMTAASTVAEDRAQAAELAKADNMLAGNTPFYDGSGSGSPSGGPTPVGGDVTPEATASVCAPWEPIGGSCAPQTKAAGAEFRKAYKDNSAMANQKMASHCMVSGHFSSYKGKIVAAGKCIRNNIAEDSGLKCAKNEVICNPLVFGVQKDGTALCTSKISESTAQCALTVNADGYEFHSAEKEFTAEKWNGLKKDFSDSFKSYCMPSANSPYKFGLAFQKYFCSECNDIGRTIVNANKDFASSLGICKAVAAPAADAKPADPVKPAGTSQ